MKAALLASVCFAALLSAACLTGEGHAQCPPGMVCVPASQFYGGGYGGPPTSTYGYQPQFGGYPQQFGYPGGMYGYSGGYSAPAPLVADSQFAAPSGGCNGSQFAGGYGFPPQFFPQPQYQFQPPPYFRPRSLSLSFRD